MITKFNESDAVIKGGLAIHTDVKLTGFELDAMTHIGIKDPDGRLVCLLGNADAEGEELRTSLAYAALFVMAPHMLVHMAELFHISTSKNELCDVADVISSLRTSLQKVEKIMEMLAKFGIVRPSEKNKEGQKNEQ